MSLITSIVPSPTVNTASATTTFPVCTWTGHCLGDFCASENDCDHDWVCRSNVCSPCCETAVTSSTSTSSPISTSTSPSAAPATNDGLSKGASAGIGIGVVALVGIMVGLGWWLYQRRRRQRPVEYPLADQPPAFSDTPEHPEEVEKYYCHGGPPEELLSPKRPAELETVELSEMEGDNRQWDPKPAGGFYAPLKYNGEPGQSPQKPLLSEQTAPLSEAIPSIKVDSSPISNPSPSSAGQPQQKGVDTEPNTKTIE